MNREILFRGKRMNNGEWVEGSLLVYADGGCLICCESCEANCLKRLAVDPATVGQYTGLKDKNGRRIFEGDIVRETFEGTSEKPDVDFGYYDEDFYGYKIGKVSFSGTGTHIISSRGELWVNGEKVEEYKPTRRRRIAAYRCEVIGNIHDNPELLEGGRG